MNLKLNDEEVIRQYLTSSPNDCFETLYNRYVNKVYNRCYSLTKDSEKAQDFTHDIFIKMFSHLDRFEERSTFSTWLYSISYNYCMDQLRLGNRLTMTALEVEDEESDTHAISTDEPVDLEYSMQQLSRAMKSLSEEEAMILRLKYQDDMDIRQIANLLQLKDSAVKMRLKRSRDKVRQLCGATIFAD
ncbi:sigma-70 family RNA polymerase sigma factor [Spirosoma aureum]|uniref:Sigma-70 family RNA polymerase sigma factor n=1 Tax=Spirosoma aureum TaxID=2692134 RepID=A0A6G9ANV2_9BACT|nr:sigma-70 family RNA polymerase sigma factor [Spirosoma aureum]QIP14147.1 sigma-70 family RNA polymerase sigma factor [Spirosoma aureum]